MDQLQQQEIEKAHKIHNDDEKQQKIPLSRKEKQGVFLLLVLYTIQGFPLGFFGQAIQLLLAENGISMKELAELAVVFYPFTFKFLLAPFQDAHYSKKFGKRKSYIVPLQYIMGLLFIYVSFSIDDLIINKNTNMLTILGFIGVFISAMQDIAVDGWVLTIFENEQHVNIGSTCNTIGQMLGMLITNSLFIQINSVKFCNQYIFDVPRDTPLVTASQFLQIIAGFVIIVTIIVHFFVDEKQKSDYIQIQDSLKNNEESQELQKNNNKKNKNNLKENKNINNNIEEQSEQQLNSVIDVLKKLRGFFTNKNLRFVIIFLLTSNMGVTTVFASFSIKLVQNGFAKEKLSLISSILIPFTFLFAVISSKQVQVKQEMHAWKKAYLSNILIALLGYIIVQSYQIIDQNNTDQLFIIVLFYQLFFTYMNTYKFIALGGFYNRISDEDVGGSSLTTLNSFSNLGGQLSEQLSLLAISAFSFTPVVIIGLIYSVIYFISFQKKILSLQIIPKLAWSLENINQKKQ